MGKDPYDPMNHWHNSFEVISIQTSSDQNPDELLYRRDYTTQLQKGFV